MVHNGSEISWSPALFCQLLRFLEQNTELLAEAGVAPEQQPWFFTKVSWDLHSEVSTPEREFVGSSVISQ